MVFRRSAIVGFTGAVLCSNAVFGQSATPSNPIDMVAKIKEEGLERSQVMDTVSYLTDVHGPRLTGSPKTKQAGEWTRQRLTDWGLENSHLEAWGPFGRGWTLETFTANMVEPGFSTLIGFPKAWSPSTPKTVRSVPILLDVSNAEELEKYRGKLLRAIVMISPPREVKALFDPPATRQTDETLLAMANADSASSRTRRRPTASAAGGPAGVNSGPAGAGGNSGAAGAGGNSGAAVPGGAGANAVAGTSTASTSTARAGTPPTAGDPRALLQSDKLQFAFREGAAIILEPGRGDGGTVFVSQATMPRKRESANPPASGDTAGARPTGRAQPWSPEATDVVPQVVLSAEHYNRIARMLQRGAQPVLEIDIGCQFYSDDLNSFNIIAEIPGTDLKDEVVMLGAHFDSWHAGTGATDNAVGCAVAMEAVRILKAIGAQPRRTIRIGLWTGEEQGLLGSRAYVAEHFGRLVPPTSEGGGTREREGQTERPRLKYETKPEYEKLSAYFNLDNGAGKIRGIYLQGNEALRPTFRAWLSPFADMGASTITLANTGGTDHLSFDSIGLPGFQFIQDPLEYDTRTHHSSMDVYERVQSDDAKQASIIMATFAYQTAMLNEKLARKPLNGDISPATTAETAVTPKVTDAAPAGADAVQAAPQPEANSK